MNPMRPHFGAVYIPRTEFEKLPKDLGLSNKVLNQIDNPYQQQQSTRDNFRHNLSKELDMHVGATGRQDGILLNTYDDTPMNSNLEPSVDNDFIPKGYQTRLTNYLDVYDVQYREGKYTDLKDRTRKSGKLDQFG
jgi:hypothetical protein